MNSFLSFYLTLACRIYVVVALVVAAVFSPLVYTVVPLAFLLAFLYVEFRAGRAGFRLPFMMLFLVLALPLMLKTLTGPWISPVFALPVLPLFDDALRNNASAADMAEEARRNPYLWSRARITPLLATLLFSLLCVGLFAIVFTNWTLLITLSVPVVYLFVMTARALVLSRTSPVVAEVVSHKVVAGDRTNVDIMLSGRSRLGGRISLISKNDWFHLTPAELPLRPTRSLGGVLDTPQLAAGRKAAPAVSPVGTSKMPRSLLRGASLANTISSPGDEGGKDGSESVVSATFSAPLAGPGAVSVTVVYLDPLGLVTASFNVEVLRLFVIPRAKYAEWLARKYLEMSRGGAAEAMSAVRPPQRASRSGLEFYGLRPYEPGDTSKAIDWKHTIKLNEVTVKEFQGTGVECALLVTNLVVSDEEEKDKLASNLITTALTMARENIPCGHAAYNEQEVVLTTQLLDPRKSLVQALNLSRSVSVVANPLRYRQPADVIRLKADILRLRGAQSLPASRLADLLDAEYNCQAMAAAGNPATKALNLALSNVRNRPNIVLLSGRNHDAASLAIAQHSLKARGYRVMTVEHGAPDSAHLSELSPARRNSGNGVQSQERTPAQGSLIDNN